MVNGALFVRLVLLFGVRSSVAANSATLDLLSASGSCGRELPSILVRDAAMMAATLCRVKRGLPLVEVGPLVCFQDVSAATLAAAGAVPCWALETDRILSKSEFGGLCSCSSTWFSGSGMGVPLDCFVSPCASGGFWIETDFRVFSMMFLVDDCSSCFPGERIKLIEALTLLIDGYVFSSQVMYGIQESAAACLLVTFARFLVLFVGWQPQPAACLMAGMLVMSCVREFMKLRGFFGSVLEGLFAFGCLFVWEGESLLAGNSPAGSGEQATGRVDVPGEKQIVAAAAAAAAAAASGCAPPQVKVETETWQKESYLWLPPSLVGQLPCRCQTLSVVIAWFVSLRKELGFLLAPSISFVMAGFGGMRLGYRGWMLWYSSTTCLYSGSVDVLVVWYGGMLAK